MIVIETALKKLKTDYNMKYVSNMKNILYLIIKKQMEVMSYQILKLKLIVTSDYLNTYFYNPENDA